MQFCQVCADPSSTEHRPRCYLGRCTKCNGFGHHTNDCRATTPLTVVTASKPAATAMMAMSSHSNNNDSFYNPYDSEDDLEALIVDVEFHKPTTEAYTVALSCEKNKIKSAKLIVKLDSGCSYNM